MTGQELIKYIKDNKLESYTFKAPIYDASGDAHIIDFQEDDIWLYKEERTAKIY